VHVRDARGTATTAEDGSFALGELPAGTQVLVVRRLGYALEELTVELREGRRIVRDVQLTRAVSLDSMRVTALGSRYRDFNFARGANVLGRFLSRDQIERRHAEETADLLLRLGGFTVEGKGLNARVYTKSAMIARPPARGARKIVAGEEKCTYVNVVIDGVQDQGINFVPPSRIVGLEAYTGPTTFSSKYHADCGLIVIWTTAWGRDDAKHAPAEGARASSKPR